MEYVNQVLGVQVKYGNVWNTHLPNFIRTRYRIQKVLLDGKEVFFVYPLIELPAVEALKKHIMRIQEMEDIPVVMILQRLTWREKQYLLANRISFIVEGKQIYLPFMAVYLQEKCDAEISEHAEILPSAQMLMLYFIYHGSGRMAASQAVKALQLTSTSISRAVRQLDGFGLVQTKKEGVQKVLYSELPPKELFEAAAGYLQNPVKYRRYVPAESIGEDLLKSGYSALAAYSMLNPSEVTCYAARSITPWNGVLTTEVLSTEHQAAIELWRYDPRKLSDADYVDRLSLALALRDDGDERIEDAVEQMLDQLWRDIDGNRN